VNCLLQTKAIPASSDQVKILGSKEEVKGFLLDVLRYCPKIISFDYKTNMADPRQSGARILCASICWQNIVSTTWPWEFTDIGLYRKIMQHLDIWKVAFDMSFEDEWASVRVPRTKIQSWAFDADSSYPRWYKNEIDKEMLLICGKDSLEEYQQIVAKMIETGVIK
jgi:hypothetical protein